jgi:hypothetical protein
MIVDFDSTENITSLKVKKMLIDVAKKLNIDTSDIKPIVLSILGMVEITDKSGLWLENRNKHSSSICLRSDNGIEFFLNFPSITETPEILSNKDRYDYFFGTAIVLNTLNPSIEDIVDFVKRYEKCYSKNITQNF